MRFRSTGFRSAGLGAALLALLAACAPPVPDSGAGVGFQDYSSYDLRRAQRDAGEQARQGATPAAPGAMISGETVSTAPLPAAGAPPLPAAPQPTVAGATPQPDAAAVVLMSDEQDFDAVASRESIQSDAERLAQIRAGYQQIQPTDLPGRQGASDTLVIDFALSTSNAVGQKTYDRPGRQSQDRFYRACAKYGSQDQAQEEFLQAGGPQRDGRGVDPDGDGFACFWDPSPFRLARQGAVAAPIAREVLPVPGTDVPAGN